MKKISLTLLPLLILIFFTAVQADFSDVDSSHPYSKAIDYVQSEGIVTGYPDGTYKPQNQISREEFVTIMARTLFSEGQIENCQDSDFPDVAKGQWFTGPICLLAKEGLIKGYADGSFGLLTNINFAESAKIISLAKGESESASDPWYKDYVDYLADGKAIPTSIKSFDHLITRGEMAEMIWRLEADVRGLGSMSYEILSGEVEDGLSDTSNPNVDWVDYTVEPYGTNLEVPWGMVFTSPSRMLVTERPGRLRVIENGVVASEPLHTFQVSSGGEEGLMSVELDPEYNQNKWIYLSYAYNKNGGMVVRVVRFKDEGTYLAEETTIIDDIPAAQYHAGTRLAFGPDGKLYITTGDATDANLAQNLDSLAGKVLRLNKDGSIPTDNPFGTAVWSYGHRNSQGLDWHPETGELYSSEHGPSGFDGPWGGDEVNRIVKGGNYGWPLVSHQETQEGTISPLQLYTPSEAPGSLMVYSGKVFPQFKGDLFVGALKGEGLLHLKLSGVDEVTISESLPEVQYGRIRNVIEGPDGYIYFSTSNRDGRGNPANQDDRIFRIRPE